MSPTICICCCEPISETSKALSRNPNICASCLSMVDGMGDANPVVELSATDEARQPKKHPESEATSEATRNKMISSEAGDQKLQKAE